MLKKKKKLWETQGFVDSSVSLFLCIALYVRILAGSPDSQGETHARNAYF